jgi:hypothetical protein
VSLRPAAAAAGNPFGNLAAAARAVKGSSSAAAAAGAADGPPSAAGKLDLYAARKRALYAIVAMVGLYKLNSV